MAYVGQGIKGGTFSVLDTSGNTYNGSNVTFDLGTQVGSPAQLLVSHDGVIQKPVTDYTIATGGTQITFTTAPASGASIFITEISGAVGAPMNRDINGDELILDADADTSITADTDDQIDIRIAGADDFQFTANTFTAQSGSTITTPTLGVVSAKDLGAGLHIKTADSGASVDSAGDELVIEGSGASGMTILSGTSSSGSIYFGDSGDNDIGYVVYNHSTNALMLGANTGEGLRVTGDGVVSIGTTETAYGNLTDAGDNGIVLTDGSASIIATNQSNPLVLARTNADNNNRDILNFNRNGSTCGQITGTNDTTTYATSSDYRLKENVTYTWDATTRLKQLKPARFNWISDSTNTLVDGFLAHEVTSIVPQAVTGEKDGMEVETIYTADDVETQGDSPSKKVGDTKTYSSTKIKPQGIDPSKLVALLVKTVQELEVRIKTLEDA